MPFLLLRLAGQGGEFVAFVLLARALAPSEFGRLSVGFLVARYLGLVADWGASIRGARDVARGSDDAAIGALIRRRTVTSIALAAAFAVIATALDSPALSVLGVVIVARGMNRDWLSLGRERGLASGASSVVQGLGLVVFAAVVHSIGAGAFAVAAGYAVGLIVSLFVNPRPRARPDASAAPVRIDGWMLGSVLADQITISADTFLLALLRGSAAAGVYAAVYRIPNVWMTLVGLAMLGMVAPTARRMTTASRAEVHDLQRRSLRLGLLAAATIVVSAIPAYIVVPVIFGPTYREGRTSLLVLMAATALMAIGASLHPLYFALARDRDVFTLAVGGTLVNLAANAVAIPVWGMVGAATATLVAQGFLLVLVVVRLRRVVADVVH